MDFVNGKIEGLHTMHLQNGEISAQNKYKNSKCIEKVSYLYREDVNGFIGMTGGKTVCKYKDRIEYMEEWWWSEEQIGRRSFSKSGQKDGLYKAWHKNGKLSLEMKYKDGKQDGLYKEWYDNGNIKSEKNWNSNIPIGIFITYFINGSKESEEIYKDGKLNGKCRKWYENGIVSQQIKYHKGEIKKRKCWTEENKKMKCEEVTPGCTDYNASNYDKSATLNCCCNYQK